MQTEITQLIPITGWYWGALSYAFFHGLHILIWRGGKASIPLLFALLFILPTFFIALIAWFSTGALWAGLAPWVTHIALAGSYFAAYPAFQATSPTIEIIHRLSSSPQGLTEKEIAGSWENAQLDSRLEDLVRAKMVRREAEKFVLVGRGKWMAQFFLSYRKLLGMPVGKG